MKKFKKIILSLISFITFICIKSSIVYARARSSGRSSGGSSRSSRSRRYNSSSRRYSNGSDSISITAIIIAFIIVIMIIAIFALIIIINLKRSKAKNNRILNDSKLLNEHSNKCLYILNRDSVKRPYLNPNALNNFVQNAFFVVEQAWSNCNILSAESYLSNNLLHSFQQELNKNTTNNLRNILEDIRLLSAIPIGVNIDKNYNDTVYYLIKGSMKDYTINLLNPQPINTFNIYPEQFMEVWKFTRIDNNWVLDDIISDNIANNTEIFMINSYR